jgi:GNAT superfamily N-acetyltransferase
MPTLPLDTPGRQRVDGSLLKRCQENSIEAYRVFARATPGGTIEERDGLVLIDDLASDSMGNVAVAVEPAKNPARTLSESERFFAPRRRPWILFAFADAAPSLQAEARRRGFRNEGRFPGLVLEPIPTEPPSLPEGVEVRTVDTIGELQLFERTASKAYEVESGPVYADWLTQPGFSFHLAYFHGEAVATATLVASHGIAGIVYVGTVPERRGRGFGRAAVQAAIFEGRELGLRVSALWATPMGRPLYEHMGFRINTEYQIWSPEAYPLPRAFHPL